jgi:hypothetical protein
VKTFAAAVLFAVMMVVPRAVEATPLLITEGRVFFEHEFGGGGRLSGTNFSLFFAYGISVIPPEDIWGVQTFIGHVPLFGNFGDAVVRVGQDECVADELDEDCGSITFTSRGLPPLPSPPVNPFRGIVPFTATGHLNVGSGFDIVGRGFLIACHGSACSGGGNSTIGYSFTSFTVDEPADALLPLLGVLVMAGMLAVARQRIIGATRP